MYQATYFALAVTFARHYEMDAVTVELSTLMRHLRAEGYLP